ncbi:MAG: MFS transporter [Acidobacteria bacterium]|nr:MFS transporter [Acidobacteriota bacterium]
MSLVSLTASRKAVSICFFLLGASYANWLSRIPTVQQNLSLSDGMLGLALLGPGIGALIAMPTAGWLIARFGSRPVTTISSIATCISLILPGWAINGPTLFVALLILGITSGAMDVAMNTQAVEVEQAYGRHIMASFHALFSVGGLTGAAMGGGVAFFNIPPAVHWLCAGLVFTFIAGAASRYLLPTAPTHESKSQPMFVKPSKALWALGLIAFCAFLSEGAMADWGAVYLHTALKTSDALAATGYIVFSLFMTTGRITGDAITHRFGSVSTVRTGSLLAGAGLAFSLFSSTYWLALLGFAAMGAGYACIVPAVFSAAGRSKVMQPGIALAAVTTLGYIGLLLGPPVIGFLSEVVTLRGALGLIVLLSALIASLAPAVSEKSDGSEILLSGTKLPSINPAPSLAD